MLRIQPVIACCVRSPPKNIISSHGKRVIRIANHPVVKWGAPDVTGQFPRNGGLGWTGVYAFQGPRMLYEEAMQKTCRSISVHTTIHILYVLTYSVLCTPYSILYAPYR